MSESLEVEVATPSEALLGEAPPSPSGPLADGVGDRRKPPLVALPRSLQLLRFNQRQIEFVFRALRLHGEVFRWRGQVKPWPVVTSHPDHVRALFTADAQLVPSLTGESPLRPIVGASSVLTSLGEQHMRQRKLLLPCFHGEAVERYAQMIDDAAEAEIDTWPLGVPFALAPRMQRITLAVIMAGVFGIEAEPARGTPEHALRAATRSLVKASANPLAQLAQLAQIGRQEPSSALRAVLQLLDRPIYALIRQRRAVEDLAQRGDILSLLLRSHTEGGELLSDTEVRDQLVTLVLAGHETTANSLAWAWERLVRAPDAYERLRHAVRHDADADANIEAALIETMRVRPVVPMIGRRVMVPWQLGDYAVPAATPVSVSVLLLHHREDLYPDPFAFKPQRWLHAKPGTYEWIPFGGGIRRCLGAALAMAEQRVVLAAMARRLDIEAAEPEPEHAVHRNVTMIPGRGARVVVRPAG